MIPKPTRPPTMPPTIGPVSFEEPEEGVDDVSVGMPAVPVDIHIACGQTPHSVIVFKIHFWLLLQVGLQIVLQEVGEQLFAIFQLLGVRAQTIINTFTYFEQLRTAKKLLKQQP